jgi:phage antirepressor YoqD-like protein
MARLTTSSDRITSAEAAALIGITEHSLRTWRYEERGPTRGTR